MYVSWKQGTCKLLLAAAAAAATIARSSVAGLARARIVVFATVIVRVVEASVIVGVLILCSGKIERWVSKLNELKI
jgi:NADH:ubiquinone oxidoreductase subunit K